MTRITALMRKINAGINIEEKTGVVVNGWSPNNIRRLIISGEGAVVQYHCASNETKNRQLLEIVAFTPEMYAAEQAEIQSRLEKGGQKIGVNYAAKTSLLSVLTTGRICSCVEEIIFLKDAMYMTYADLYANDTNVAALAVRAPHGDMMKVLQGRYPRLHSLVYMSGIALTPLMNIVIKDGFYKQGGKKLTDCSELEQYITKTVSINPKTWMTGSSLRPQYYSLDREGSILAKKFEETRTEYELMQKKENKTKLESAGVELALQEGGKAIGFAVKLIAEADLLVERLTANLGLDKQQIWGKVLKNRHKILGKYTVAASKEYREYFEAIRGYKSDELLPLVSNFVEPDTWRIFIDFAKHVADEGIGNGWDNGGKDVVIVKKDISKLTQLVVLLMNDYYSVLVSTILAYMNKGGKESLGASYAKQLVFKNEKNPVKGKLVYTYGAIKLSNKTNNIDYSGKLFDDMIAVGIGVKITQTNPQAISESMRYAMGLLGVL